MAKIQLSESNGSFIREAGEKVLLQIIKATYDPEYGKVEIELKNEKGEVVNNNFGLMANDGSANEPAIKAFSYFTRVAMGDWGVDEVEPEDLVGRHIRADIKMVPGKKANKDGEIMTFANIDKVYMTDDRFETAPKAAAKVKAQAAQVEEDDDAGEDDEDWN